MGATGRWRRQQQKKRQQLQELKKTFDTIKNSQFKVGGEESLISMMRHEINKLEAELSGALP